jgi:predicted GH43/DUF377 family glycosyl hydrolase
MSQTNLYPRRFEPIYQYRLWGGRRLAALLPEALLIRYRSAEPVLQPELPQERSGTIANVVFPTGIDRRDDLGCPDRFDIYYGMADTRIGVARLDVPEWGAADDPPGARV